MLHIKKEAEIMKVLRISDNRGEFSLDGVIWKQIDQIGKDDLITLLDVFIQNECEIDEYTEENLQNKAHYIIYSNLYAKLKELEPNKTRFRDEVDGLYKDAFNKYKDIE